MRLRTAAEAARAADFARLPVIARRVAGVVTVGDLATVTEGFRDQDLEARFDGEPGGLPDGDPGAGRPVARRHERPSSTSSGTFRSPRASR